MPLLEFPHLSFQYKVFSMTMAKQETLLRVASGPRVKLAGCKSALNPLVVYSTDRSKAAVPALVLLFVAL